MPPLFATEPLYRDIFYAAFIIWLLPEVILSFTRRTASDAKVNDRASALVLYLCIYLGIFAAINMAFAFHSFDIPWQRIALFYIGIFLMLAGTLFRQYAVRVLGKYFTLRVAIQPGQPVVEDGPYRWIRHPSYSGALLTLFGLGLTLTNGLSLLVVVALPFIGYSYRAGVEEKTLVNALGEPYRQYMKRTRRFIPFVY